MISSHNTDGFSFLQTVYIGQVSTTYCLHMFILRV